MRQDPAAACSLCCLQVARLELLGITHTCSLRRPWHSQLSLSTELLHYSWCLAAGAVQGTGLGAQLCRLQWANQPSVPSLCHALPAESLCWAVCYSKKRSRRTDTAALQRGAAQHLSALQCASTEQVGVLAWTSCCLVGPVALLRSGTGLNTHLEAAAQRCKARAGVQDLLKAALRHPRTVLAGGVFVSFVAACAAGLSL